MDLRSLVRALGGVGRLEHEVPEDAVHVHEGDGEEHAQQTHGLRRPGDA